MAFIRQWPLYGSTVFDVLQGYTSTLPKNLWLVVNEMGIHILKRRDKEPLVTYDYKQIVNYRYVCICNEGVWFGVWCNEGVWCSEGVWCNESFL